MPSLTEQVRVARCRRARHRRAVLSLLVAPVVLALCIAVVGASDGLTDTSSPEATTSAMATPSTATSMQSPPTDLVPGLVTAFGRAQAAAADDGFELAITSGFRTAEEQASLLEAEVAERGSLEEAVWWVFPPDRSMHVQGLAIDVGDGPAADWLAEEGSRYGLCRTLAWEWWHFEWRERWEVAGACPPPAQHPADAPAR